MATKDPSDKDIEDRVRGHIRQRMARRSVGVTEMARTLGISQGRLSHILNEDRGVSLGFAYLVSHRLGIDPDVLLNKDPPAEFMVRGAPGPAAAS